MTEDLDIIVKNLVCDFEIQRNVFTNKIKDIAKNTFKINKLPDDEELNYIYLINPYIKHIEPLYDDVEICTEGFIIEYIQDLISNINNNNKNLWTIYDYYENDENNVRTTINITRNNEGDEKKNNDDFKIIFEYCDEDDYDEDYKEIIEDVELRISKNNLLDILWEISNIIDRKLNGEPINNINYVKDEDDDDYNDKEEIISRGFISNMWYTVKGIFG